MEVCIISTENVRPSSPVNDFKPFKLSLLDQLTPATYSPLIIFFPINDSKHSKTAQISNRLKWSLSETLSHYYPLSGRLCGNLIIQDYDSGVPYKEARVKGRMCDLLQRPQLELLNRFLPCEPFCHQANPSCSQFAAQVNVFDCGGMALGLCFSHKINDGTATASFMRTWEAVSSGNSAKVVLPKLSDGSSLFPPLESVPPHYVLILEGAWFGEGNEYATKRFVFDDNAIATLRAKAKSKLVENPTRLQALCAFIWKSAMMASKSISGQYRARPSVLTQAVNLRRLTRPRLSNHSFGNIVWSATAGYSPNESDQIDMAGLVALISGSVARIDSQFVKNLTGDKGSEAIFEQISILAEISKENAQKFSFASWHGFRTSDGDFGWGKPVWTGVFGEPSRNNPSDSNFTIFKDTGNKEMEAWVTLDEKVLAVIEQDPEFLAFASLNPSIPSG